MTELEGTISNMKRLIGTITLSFVEEDNKQRVIFRIVPLCTREGVTFRDAMETFPDQGSLRIVPDKREQSTFKERMREVGKLCVIELLVSDGKEMAKVRKNKNYAPAQGELNQNAIYSDVIQGFAPDGAFEVIEWSERLTRPAEVLTQTVLLLSNKVLYGPVAHEDMENVQLSELKPFGNAQFLLHTVELPDQTAHTLYWNPEATLNWRRRRGSFRRKTDKEERFEMDIEGFLGQEAEEERFLTDESDNTQVDGVPAVHEDSLKNPLQRSLLKQEQTDPKAGEELAAALPIGTKLEILDTSIPFEQQISRLDQPLPEGANRLARELTQKQDENSAASVRYAGTPFVRDVAHMPKTISRPEPFHHVVEQKMRLSREDRFGVELQGGISMRMENPVENLLMAVDTAWQNKETREQAISVLLENQGFSDSLLGALRVKGHEIHAVAAAHAQLAEFEAERLSLLMHLEQAKENKKRYQEQMIASVSQKKQEEIAKLTQDIQTLSQEKEKLLAALKSLSEQAAEQQANALRDWLPSLGGIAGSGDILVSPVVGKHRDVKEMLEALCLRLGGYGFSMCEDDAMLLLIVFSLFPSFCLQAERPEDAKLFATALLEALGLLNVSATLRQDSAVQISSLLAENEFRTPTVTIQSLGTSMLSVFGHKTIFIAHESDITLHANGIPSLFPIIRVPKIGEPKLDAAETSSSAEPAALSSFLELTAEVHPLLEEGKKWFQALEDQFRSAGVSISDASLLNMRRFVEVSSCKLRGGFLAAADIAICCWIVPQFLHKQMDMAELSPALSGLPRALEALGIR